MAIESSIIDSDNALPFHKKNGVIHWRRCAEFYGAKNGLTAREWYRSGAPLLYPSKMREWLQDREDERLSKISEKNTLYRPKEPEIVRLHVEEKMGIKAISKHFSGRPSSPGVRAILIRNGVYLGHETYNRQVRASVERRVKHVNDEKERRHRLAVCLMGLRKGCGIETTCKQEGWNKSSIWNTLSQRVSYKKFKVRQKPRWVDKRIYGNAYSRIFLRESLFQSVIEGILKEAGFKFIPQYRISDALTKVDIKMEDGTFVELKVALNSGQSYEFIGSSGIGV